MCDWTVLERRLTPGQPAAPPRRVGHRWTVRSAASGTAQGRES